MPTPEEKMKPLVNAYLRDAQRRYGVRTEEMRVGTPQWVVTAYGERAREFVSEAAGVLPAISVRNGDAPCWPRILFAVMAGTAAILTYFYLLLLGA